jgi:hypothetical protein
MSVLRFTSNFLRGVWSCFDVDPQGPPRRPGFRVLTADEINRRAWQMVGDSLWAGLRRFEAEGAANGEGQGQAPDAGPATEPAPRAGG